MTEDESPTLKRSPMSNKFPLMSAPPKVDNESGTITIANKESFPILDGNEAAVFMVKMKAGAVREPHWHPNCWELNVVLSGRAKVGVVNPDDTRSECEIGVGEVSFIPMGFFHYIEALEDLTLTVVFNADMPQDIGLSTGFAGMPTKMFEATFGHSMSGFPKPNKTLFLVPGRT